MWEPLPGDTFFPVPILQMSTLRQGRCSHSREPRRHLVLRSDRKALAVGIATMNAEMRNFEGLNLELSYNLGWWFSSWGDFARLGDIWQCLETFFWLSCWGKGIPGI